jgi:hypothetical protein
MPKILVSEVDSVPPVDCQIRVKGHLSSEWTEWFDGMVITLEGEDLTVLSGPVADQAALYGLLKKVRDLGLPLLSVNCVESSQGVGPGDERPAQKIEEE